LVELSRALKSTRCALFALHVPRRSSSLPIENFGGNGNVNCDDFLTLCRDQSPYCSIASSPISYYSKKNSLILCVVIRLLLLRRLCFRCSSSARNETMSDIHRRVVRRALLQTGHLDVDPEKARRGLLSFRSRRKRGNTKAASGGEEEEDLPVPSAAPSSKRKRTSDFGVEETIDGGSRSPVKRSSAPSKLPPK
jgi:hypothetical protein